MAAGAGAKHLGGATLLALTFASLIPMSFDVKPPAAKPVRSGAGRPAGQPTDIVLRNELSPPEPPARTAQPIRAMFRVGSGRRVRLTFENDENFRLDSADGATSTIVLAGQVYLHFRPSPKARPRLLWVATLARRAPGRVVQAGPRLPASLPAALVRHWRMPAPVFDLVVPALGRFGERERVTVSANAGLAAAQAAVATRLVPAMDMSLCGDVVSELVGWWPADLTQSGLAVVGTSSGVVLTGPVTAWGGKLRPPAGIPVEAGLRSITRERRTAKS